MESLFRRPLCAQPLDREDRRYHCPQGHSFDRGAAGYVHLLPANQKHAKDPGTTRAWPPPEPLPLRGPLCPSAGDPGPAGPGPHPGPPRPPGRRPRGGVLQRRPLPNPGPGGGKNAPAGGGGSVQTRPAPGGQAGPRREFAVASVYHLPVADGVADLLVDCFSPWPSRSFGGC